MTQQKQSKVLFWFNTIGIPVIILLASGCFKFLWTINGYMERTQITDQVQSAAIADIRVTAGVADNGNMSNKIRISYLEAILNQKFGFKFPTQSP